MNVLWLILFGITGCITTYADEQIDLKDSQASAPFEVKSGTIAIFPVEYKGPANCVRDRQFLINLQQQIASQISTRGFEHVILLNEINMNDVRADNYLKVAFEEENYGEAVGLFFSITLGIFPLILPFESPHRNVAEIQIFDSSRNRLHFQTVTREGRRFWHSTLIPIGLGWDHEKRENAIRDDVINDILNVTNKTLGGAAG